LKKVKKYATIDIGSNAIRLLISNVYSDRSNVYVTKNSLVRVPLRLGQDSFKKGKISKENILRLLDSIKSFKLLMKVHKVEKYLAYATSALRSSSNGREIVALILKKTKIRVEIITGKKEAQLITNNQSFLKKDNIYCFVDVGGGSTELTLIKNKEIIISKSFKIGGVRLINNLVKKSTWNKLDQWINTNINKFEQVNLVGIGGNINKIFKLSGNNIGKSLTKKSLDNSLHDLSKMSVYDKVIKLKLNPDRVDVIVPAGEIYQFVMNKMNSNEILVPKIGLADGMVHELLNNL
jgi:exopolyphosphatase/guanosine-5'-triphosphate,3'-diphosphate pyrophosphatase